VPDLYVDTRWSGHRGITRYANEVGSRLTTPRQTWTSHIGPTSPLDVFAPARLRLTRYDVLYSPGFSAGLARCRQLITLHDLTHLGEHDPRSSINRVFYERVIKPSIRRAGHVMTVSQTSKEAIDAWLRDDSVDIHVTGEGTRPEFTPDGPAAEQQRPYFLYVGNMREHKNPGIFLKALTGLPDHGGVMVSSDAGLAQAMVQRYGLDSRVSVLTGIGDAELARMYRGAKALVIPSLSEGFGLPALEALRSHCPVVYYAGCGSLAEICGPGEGRVESSSDAAAWRTAMVSVGPPTAEQLGLTQFQTWENAARVVDDVLNTML
jgi:glycosyltransferase involved in cell wall biosynthesis